MSLSSGSTSLSEDTSSLNGDAISVASYAPLVVEDTVNPVVVSAIDGVVKPPGAWGIDDVNAKRKTIHRTKKGTRRLVDVVSGPKVSDSTLALRNLPDQEVATTLVLRNLPAHLSRSQLLGLLDAQGLHGFYDFVYLPTNFKRASTFGYAIVNFTLQTYARIAHWRCRSLEVCGRPVKCEWSASVQGKSALVEKYRNSQVMHDSIADTHRPLLLSDGKPVPFPSPTEAGLK